MVTLPLKSIHAVASFESIILDANCPVFIPPVLQLICCERDTKSSFWVPISRRARPKIGT